MSARFVPLTAELMAQMALRDADAAVALPTDPASPVYRHAHALLADGHVMAAGGIVPLWAGRGLCWFLFSRFARPRHVTQCARFGRGWFDQLQRAGVFVRLEATALAAAPAAGRFLKHAGFDEPRALLRRYGPDGADHLLYARVR